MNMLRKLARLDGTERRLLAEAAIVVPVVRVALTLLPFRVVHRGIAAATRRARPSTSVGTPTPERVTWAVTAVAARVPRASCLTQALAATLLLVRRGHDATLRFGVAKKDDGTFRAHVWVEINGRAILGEPEPGAFAPFPPVSFSRR